MSGRRRPAASNAAAPPGRARGGELEKIGQLRMERLGVIAPAASLLPPPPNGHDLKPTRERHRHGRVKRLDRQIVDSAGRPGAPWLASGILVQLAERAKAAHEAGRLSADEFGHELLLVAAGERFHTLFRRAALPDLRAAALVRVDGMAADPHNGNESARREIGEAIRALGGHRAIAASCVWHVVGLEDSLRKWATTHWNCQQAGAMMVLRAGLGVCAGHFRLDRVKFKS